MQHQTMILGDGSVIIPIHFTIMDGTVEHIACAPRLRHLHSHNNKPAWQRTTDARVVTCPVCKETEEFKVAVAESTPLPRQTFKLVPA